MSNRKYPLSKRYAVKEVGGQLVTFTVVDDLDEKEIIDHLEYALAGEDWEYCQVLASEAEFRGITIKESLHKFFKA